MYIDVSIEATACATVLIRYDIFSNKGVLAKIGFSLSRVQNTAVSVLEKTTVLVLVFKTNPALIYAAKQRKPS